jgi:LPXTG-site transpeptidase (sortase) family protein
LSVHSPTRDGSSSGGIRRHLAPLLLFSGVAVLGYVGFQYGAMLFEQRHLQALWREQQRTNRSVAPRSLVVRHESSLTRISIPSIQLSAVIVEGTDSFSLLLGPGHLIGTAQPGDPGNSVVSAHRDTFFRKIVNLRQGDHILVERDGRTFTYVVEGFSIVKPGDISVAAPTRDNRLTLITCDPAYYAGPAPQRLVVTSKLLATPDAVLPGIEVSKQLQSRSRVQPIKKVKVRDTVR